MNIENIINIGSKPEMQRYLRMYNINTGTCSNSYICKQNVDVYEIHKKQRKKPQMT